MSDFTANAVLTNDARARHHREHDHKGSDLDLYVALSGPVGPWTAGTPIHFVLADLVTRISQLESGSVLVRPGAFSAYAYFIGTTIYANAVIGGTASGSLTANAVLNDWTQFGSFSANAVVNIGSSFTAAAVVI